MAETAEPAHVAAPPLAGRRDVWALIVLVALFRIFMAAVVPLGVDEAYAVAAAREFSISYFDHPPLGFLSPVVMARLTGLEHPFILRLPDLLFGAIAAWLMWKIGQELGGRRAALWTLALFGLSPVFVFAGVAILPDGPLEMASAGTVLWLVRIARAGDRAGIAHWLRAGAWLALALASKYQAGLIPISVFAFALLHPKARRWLLSPGPWLASAVALIGLVPVLLWNASNGWASFAFHAGRTGDGLQPLNALRMVLGQIVYLLPPVFLAGLMGLIAALRSGRMERQLVAAVALGPIVMFNLIYLFSAHSFPHWTMPGWQFAMPLGALWLAEGGPAIRRRMRFWMILFLVPVALFLIALALHTRTGLLTRFTHAEPPAWDHTIDVFDYTPLEARLQARGDLEGIRMIAVPGWMSAGPMSLALGGRYPVRVLWGNRHHFSFLKGQRPGGPALVLEPVRPDAAESRAAVLLDALRGIDPHVRQKKPVVLARGGIPYVAVLVFRLNLPPVQDAPAKGE